MGQIELRDLNDDDLDAVFEMMRDPEAVRMAAFTGADPDDRDAFDAWIARNRALEGVLQFVVTDAAASPAPPRPSTSRPTAKSRTGSPGTPGAAALRPRLCSCCSRGSRCGPWRARVAVHNGASRRVLEKCGFTEVSRDSGFAPGVGRIVEEIVYVLTPTLDDN